MSRRFFKPFLAVMTALVMLSAFSPAVAGGSYAMTTRSAKVYLDKDLTREYGTVASGEVVYMISSSLNAAGTTVAQVVFGVDYILRTAWMDFMYADPLSPQEEADYAARAAEGMLFSAGVRLLNVSFREAEKTSAADETGIDGGQPGTPVPQPTETAVPTAAPTAAPSPAAGAAEGSDYSYFEQNFHFDANYERRGRTAEPAPTETAAPVMTTAEPAGASGTAGPETVQEPIRIEIPESYGSTETAALPSAEPENGETDDIAARFNPYYEAEEFAVSEEDEQQPVLTSAETAAPEPVEEEKAEQELVRPEASETAQPAAAEPAAAETAQPTAAEPAAAETVQPEALEEEEGGITMLGAYPAVTVFDGSGQWEKWEEYEGVSEFVTAAAFSVDGTVLCDLFPVTDDPSVLPRIQLSGDYIVRVLLPAEMGINTLEDFAAFIAKAPFRILHYAGAAEDSTQWYLPLKVTSGGAEYTLIAGPVYESDLNSAVDLIESCDVKTALQSYVALEWLTAEQVSGLID